MKWRRYKEGCGYSYVFGAFPTMELVETRPEVIVEILVLEKFQDRKYLQILEEKKIPWRYDDRTIHRLANKGNIYIVGVFRTYLDPVLDGNHVLCHEIGDMGNLGNICRTLLAMGIKDLVTISNSCDIYDPRSIRASMGAFFHLRYSHYDSIEAYLKDFPNQKLYSFLLDERAEKLPAVEVQKPWSLVFGNESRGLPPSFSNLGKSIFIPQSDLVDSFNITTAVAIALYQFQMLGEEYGSIH